ncbi:MAG: hypothetical protein AAF434_07310 [Pseudomonadota bacterium]
MSDSTENITESARPRSLVLPITLGVLVVSIYVGTLIYHIVI